MKRYPHSAVLQLETETDDGSGIPVVSTQTIEIPKGRYEPAGQNKQLDQAAKFFCPKLDILKENPLALNGQKLFVNGGWIGIINAWNYQMHCEIWLD